VVTDDSGLARILVRLGAENGDWRIEAEVLRAGRGRLKEHFRLVSGVVKLVEETESVVGQKLPLSLRLLRQGKEGLEPLEKRVVFFRLVGEPPGPGEGAKLTNGRDVTDANGERRGTDLTLGDEAGVYHVLAEVEPHGEDRPLRGILYRIIAMDWYAVGLKLASGLLLFLLGVRFLGNGFLLVLSPHLHLGTGVLAENRFLGYLGGMLAGATFQSSSTVHSYLASFANGGLLSARGALGLCLGACFGATVLPQILTLELDFLVAPLLGAGLLCFLLPRRAHLVSWGWVFLGAGLVFASWNVLSAGAEDLSLSQKFRAEVLPGDAGESASFAGALRRSAVYFSAAAAVSFLMRTSNLVVLSAILLAAKGVIAPTSGLPLILGANLGAALMTFSRALVKQREARRVGLVCLSLHFWSTLCFLGLSLVAVQGSSIFLWLVEWATPGHLFHPVPENVAQHLAMAHSVYNLFGSLVFLVVPGALFRAVDRVLPPRKAGEIKPYHLDENLVTVPALALRQTTEEVVYLTQLCQKTIAEAFDSFRYADLKLSDQVVRREEVISGLQRDVTRYLVLVGENQLSRHDASELEVLQTAAGNLGRIGELGERLRDLTSRRIEERVDASAETDRDLSEVYDLVMAQFDNILILLKQRSSRVEESAVKLVERLTKYRSRLEVQWRQRLETGPDAAAVPAAPEPRSPLVPVHALIYQEAFDVLFRAAAHLAHIAQRMRILSPERL
jgi:phosphate:Na+ symporter